ncbi:DUF91 domain-containing protein [Providencia rettgeri]|nr:DUF91 domain-containing protein [Providencia rettgeri]
MDKIKLTEAKIRDYIAENLSLIEPSLEFIGKEYYLPNTEGAAGFLDIFARDSKGKLVIIEIKRTNAAAREAIQELYKYVSLIRSRLLVKNEEIRLILLSVQWHELRSPVSEFYSETPFEISVGKINLNEQGIPTSITPVLITSSSAERKIGIRHFLWGFPNEGAAELAIPLIETKIKNSGLKDFVLIKSNATSESLAGRSFIYFAQRELLLEEYLQLIKKNSSKIQFSEFEKNLETLTEIDDKIAEASDEVWLGTYGMPHRQFGADTAEISSLEKGYGWFEEGAQNNIKIYRFGRFDDEWLDDDTIIKEIRGYNGASTVLLDFIANTSSPPEMKALAKGVNNVFFYNQTWQGAVHKLIHYAKNKQGNIKIAVRAFNPEDILRSIAASVFGYPAYTPTFNVDIECEGNLERFIGIVEWNGRQPDFNKIIGDHFEGEMLGYFTACHFGENKTINHDVMLDLGLSYSVLRVNANKSQRIRVQGSSIIPIKGEVRSLNQLVSEYENETIQLAKQFMAVDSGFAEIIAQYYLHIDAEQHISKLIEKNTKKTETYWLGDINKCDSCNYPFSLLKFMVDTIFLGGFGANLCAYCFLQQGRGLGTGRGQMYRATTKGWLYIAG